MILFIATAFAAEPDAPISSEVNPTVKYLTEQFSATVEKGLPLASASVQEIANQIHYLGVGLLIYDGLFFLLSVVCWVIFYKTMSSFKENTEAEEEWPRFIGACLSGAAGVAFLVNGVFHTPEHIKMTAAPMVWALQEMM